MASGDVWKATLVFSNLSNGATETTGHYLSESASGPPTAAEIATIWRNAWNTSWGGGGVAIASVYDDNMQLDGVALRKVDPESAVQTFDDGGDVTVGDESSDNLPPQSALLVSIRTGSIGRRYRGRMYWPPIAETIQTGAGTFAEATADALAIQFAATFAEIEDLASVANVGVFSAKAIDDPGPPPTYLDPIFTPFTVVKVDRRLRSQRRRMDRTPLYSTA